jgi:outer membrane protein W
MGSFTPYGGVGIGYEILSGKTTAGSVEATSSYSGLEFLNLQAGLDIPVATGLNIGPFVSFSLGQYSSFKQTSSGTEVSLDLPKSMHEWLFLGIGGSYDL